MHILSLDLGTTTGWCFYDDLGHEVGHFTHKTYSPWGKDLKELLDRFKPDIIVCSQTNNFGYMNATRKMFMLLGITCYIAEKKGLPVVEFNDKQARKYVLGTGKGGLKKAVIHDLLHIKYSFTVSMTGDELDAYCLSLGWHLMNLNNEEV